MEFFFLKPLQTQNSLANILACHSQTEKDKIYAQMITRLDRVFWFLNFSDLAIHPH